MKIAILSRKSSLYSTSRLKEAGEKRGHEMKVIEEVCSRVAIIHHSRIAEVGTVADIFLRPKTDAARALILPQRLLLLDEPTAALDAGARSALVRRLAELKAQGVAMIGVFHHPGDVAGLIDRDIELTVQEAMDDVAV